MISGALGFLAVLALIALRVPVAIAMAVVGALGYGFVNGWSTLGFVLGRAPFESVFPISLTVVPLFVMMGVFSAYGGLSSSLYRLVSALIGHLQGRPRHGDHRRLRGLRRGVRLRDRHRRHHGPRGDARDAPRALRRPARLGHHRRGRHARGDDPALDPLRPLRADDRAVHRQALRRGRAAGDRRDAALHGGDPLHDLAPPCARTRRPARRARGAPQGAARRVAGAAPLRRGARRHVRGLLLAHRGGGRGRVRRDPDLVPARAHGRARASSPRCARPRSPPA